MELECALSKALRQAYAAGAEDEKMEPFVLVDGGGAPIGRFEDGDAVIFYDLRGEREIELTQSLTDPGFDEFPVKRPLRLSFATLIEYDPSLAVIHDVRTDDADVGARDGASVGYLLRKHGYPLRVVVRMLVRPLGGALLSLLRRDGGRARYRLATFGGRVRGYRGAKRSNSSA